ncbi:hypothetical protein FACS1894202_04700 [Clostridia bacterium]|nr:hypothetical protein FACS1894202_04700 [Clostridia bacterium]
MKRLLALSLALAMTLTLSACGGSGTESPPPSESPSAAAPTPSPSEEPTPEPSPDPTPEPVLYSNDFETDLNGWGLRQGSSGTVELADVGHDSGHSLYMSGRTATWHGAAIDGAALFVNGETYHISLWAKQETGASQTLTFAFQFSDDSGSQQWTGHVTADAPSGEWVLLEGDYTIPDGTTDGLILYVESTETGDFWVDDVTIDGKKVEIGEPKDLSEFYNEMITASLVSTGNNARLKAAIQKAKDGKEVTIAYIGGSITEGYNASPNSSCYASKSAESFKALFGGNVNVVNAGMAGTPSDLGVIRYPGDVLAVAPTPPDIVFIEFAVNDGDDVTGGVAYESLVRNVLKADNAPAVVLLFAVFQSQWNMQDKYIPLGEKYGLPMVSIKDAVVPQIKSGAMTNDQFFASDGLHPINQGHQIMSDCVTNLFKLVDAESAKTAEALPDPLFGNDYEGIKLADSGNVAGIKGLSVTPGGFGAADTATGTFQFNGKLKLPNNWKHEATADNTPFTLKAKSKNLMLVYKFSNSQTAGKAEVLVDGNVVATLNSFKSDGWNNATTVKVFTEASAKEHTVEVRMAAGDEGKEFTILAIGYTE